MEVKTGIVSLFFAIALTSCMQAEKVSLDTSGAEGLLISGLSVQLGLFGGGGTGSTCYAGGTCRIAVTTATYDGGMGGVAGADTKCQTEFPGYRALIFGNAGGNERYPGTNWVLKSGTSYTRLSGVPIGTTSASSATFVFPLQNGWNGAANSVYIGANNDWTINTVWTCSNWISNTAVGGYGSTNVTDSSAIDPGNALSCSIARNLLCVEQ